MNKRDSFFFWASVLCVVLLSAALGVTVSAQEIPQTRLTPVDGSQTSVGDHAARRQRLERNENGTFWEFAPSQPYHDTAVRVSAGNSGGSGTLVGTNGQITLMVTNHHVVATYGISCASVVRAHMRDGTVLTCRHLLATPREDVAVYRVDRNDLPCVAVSSDNAPAGAIIETMAFGGPWHHKAAFRPFIAKTVPTNLALAVDAPAISGDSGAGMIYEGVLVGVNWGADSRPTQSAGVSDGSGVSLVYPATSSADATFLQRFLTQACRPYGCQPIINRPGYLIPRPDQRWERQPQEFPGPEQFYRPVTPDNDDQPALPSPSTNPPLSLPPESLVGPQGPAGPQGPPSEPGPPGADGRNAEVTPEQLAAIAAAITEQLKNDPELCGPAGPEGPQGPPGEPAEIDYDKLAQEVASRLPPLTLKLRDGDGNVIDNDLIPVGGVLDLQFIEKIASNDQ